MSVHISSLGLPLGYMVSDWNFLYCQGAIGRTAISFSPNLRRQKLFVGADVSLRTSNSRYPTVVSMCKAGSNKRNPDFSRKYRGSSKGRRQSQEKENSENLEDNLLSSKNGSLVSLPNNQRFSATATPGRREKEIVELFRKVQLQLRERAAIKEEKRVESAQLGQGERGTVDSLLKLLRKHSAAQRKKSSSDDGYDLDLPEKTNTFDEPERSDLFEEEQNSSFFGSDSLGAQDGDHELKPFSSSRPISRFRRKSPVPKVKFQPVFSAEEEGSRSIPILNSQEIIGEESEPELAALDPQPRHVLEPEVEPSMKFESLDGESEMRFDPSDSSDSDETDPDISESEPSIITQGLDLSSMKLSELRGLAKSRGFKGYTKLKKIELFELLTENNSLD